MALSHLFDNLEPLRNRVAGSVDAIFAQMLTGTPSDWYKTVQPGVLVKGYFKFVEPTDGDAALRMDLAAYVAVFNALFKQYYPYEHVDRPEKPDRVMSTVADHYDDERNVDPHDPRITTRPAPDMYVYLRDDSRIIAGRLADLELNWASRLTR